MAVSPKRVVLDTNILISAIIYGGRPGEVLSLVIAKEIFAIISPFILAELTDVLGKKFDLIAEDILLIERQIKKHFNLVYPKQSVSILTHGNPDNRVLEAAVEGKCDYIITGDKELLALKVFQNINIITTSQFLEI